MGLDLITPDSVFDKPDWFSYFNTELILHPKIRWLLHRAKNSFEYFLTQLMGLKLADFHIEIVSALVKEGNNHIILTMPREHGKSTLVCECYVAWRMFRDPGLYVLIFSNTEPQARARVKAIKLIFETIPLLKGLRQPARADWGKDKFMLLNGAYCEAYGAGSQVAGSKSGVRRPGLIIGDDIVATGQRMTVSDDSMEEWWYESITNLGGPDCQTCVVGTPYRDTDIVAKLKRNPEYKSLHYEALKGKDIDALYEDDTETLWPEHWPLERLRHKLKALDNNKIVFIRQYLCRIVSKGTMLYPPELVNPCKDPNFKVCYSRADAVIPYSAVIGGVDLASSGTASSDYFVVTIFGITPNNGFDFLWIERHKGLTFKQQKELLKHLHDRYQFDLLSVEKNGYQMMLSQEVMEDTIIPVLPHFTQYNKQDETIGIVRVSVHMSNYRIRYPAHPDNVRFTQCTFGIAQDDHGRNNVIVYGNGGVPVTRSMEALFSEMSGWHRNNNKWETSMEHDDTVLSQWIAIHASERMGGGINLIGDISMAYSPSSVEKDDKRGYVDGYGGIINL